MNDHGIEKVYEDIAVWFDQNRGKELMERTYLEALLRQVQANPSVLDLGCGSGEPIARFLIEQGCQVTGVDRSASMLAMCRERFPTMNWIQGDMRSLVLYRTFDAIVAWDSFFHLPPEAQRMMFPVFAAHTAPGGVVLFNTGEAQGTTYGVMNGHRVYHASLDTSEYRSLLENYGFDVLLHTVKDVTCGNRTVWLAKKVSR